MISKDRQDSFLKQFRESHPKPYYSFLDLPDSEKLSYEMLSLENHYAVPKMFSEENNPFVIDEYKDEDKFSQYTQYHLNYNRFSPKNGGCDWLFKLKDSEEYIGILNVYDLNRENIADRHLRCTIGFNTRIECRRKGYTLEAVKHLLEYIPDQFGRTIVLAYTHKNNYPSINLLMKLGFVNKSDEYTNDKYSFFERTLPLTQ